MERKGNNIAEDTFLYWMDVERYMAEFKEGNFNNYEECQTVLRHLALREFAEKYAREEAPVEDEVPFH